MISTIIIISKHRLGADVKYYLASLLGASQTCYENRLVSCCVIVHSTATTKQAGLFIHTNRVQSGCHTRFL